MSSLLVVYLAYIGPTSIKFGKQIKTAVRTCFAALKPRVVYSIKDLCPANKKDVLPVFQQSNVIYQSSCHCDSRYVGRTFQRLQDRIKQYITKLIRNTACPQTRIRPKRDCKSSNQVPTNSVFILRFCHQITSITQSHMCTKLR